MSDTPEPMAGADDGTLKGKLDRIALAFAESIILGKPIDKQQIEIFRSLVQYQGMARKMGAPDDTEPPGASFESFRDSIAAASPKISNRNGN